jgi:hypothetical protein
MLSKFRHIGLIRGVFWIHGGQEKRSQKARYSVSHPDDLHLLILRSFEARSYAEFVKALELPFNEVSLKDIKLKDIKNWFRNGCYCTSSD